MAVSAEKAFLGGRGESGECVVGVRVCVRLL